MAAAVEEKSSETQTREIVVDEELKKKWIAEQRKLKERLVETNDLGFSLEESDSASGKEPLRVIAGVDISTHKKHPNEACAGVVVMKWPTCEVLHSVTSFVRIEEPYIAGFLAFREVRHLVALFKELSEELKPQLVFVDGNGVFHFRGFGLASHLGVLIDTPTVGIAKNFLTMDGWTTSEFRDEWRRLVKQPSFDGEYTIVGHDSGKQLGVALQCSAFATEAVKHKAVNPVFVSVGHRICLRTAVELTKRVCGSGFKIPEPIRKADHLTRELIRGKFDTAKKKKPGRKKIAVRSGE